MVLVLLNSQHQKNKPQPTQQTTITDQRGTQESPIVVKVLPAQKAPEETVQDAEDRKNKRENDGNIVDLTAVLAIVAVLQLGVYGYQSYQLTKTVRSAGEQSAAMDRHIDEAARSATAMETIAATIQTGNRAIMRAYLTVNIGGGTYQERNRVGQADIKFAVGPTVANTGNTHARNVRIRKKAAFFPSVLPNDFAYEELGPETEASFATVAAHQSYTINAVVDDFVPDTEVSLIKVGDGTNLHVWGKIIYEDIFGDTHITKFGQWIVFVPPNNQILGWYTPGQNDAD
jgi:hypothetical protein